MGNYAPAASSTNYTFQASGPITGGDPVEFSGDGQVRRFAGGRYAGISGQDATAGHPVVVYVGSVIFPGYPGTTVEGAVSSGDDLTASSVPGRQVRTASPGDRVIGQAFSDAVDGALVKWHQK